LTIEHLMRYSIYTSIAALHFRFELALLPQLEQTQLELNRQWEESSTTYKELRLKFKDLQIEDQESQFKDPQKAKIFLEQKLSNSEIKIREAESKIREFREKNNITDLALEAVNSVKTINKLNQGITTASAQLATAKYRIDKMQTFLDTKMPSIMQSKSPGIKEAITALQQAQEKLVLERTRFSDTNPSIIDLQQKIQDLEAKLSRRYQQDLASKSPNIKSALQAEIIKEYATATIQKMVLEKQIDAFLSVTQAYRDRANRLPQLAQTQEELNRQLEISLISHKNLVVRLQNPGRPVKRVPDCSQPKQ
jgi:polysaccharide biosynthesis transport protein